MFKKLIFAFIFSTVLCLVGCGGQTQRANLASLEEQPISPGIAPLDQAMTLAQSTNNGVINTILVVGLESEHIFGVDLSKVGIKPDPDLFIVADQVTPEILERVKHSPDLATRYQIADLLPAAGNSLRHVASGTNFPEHAEEANNDSVFNFPKFGPARPARTTVDYKADVLLDYEVEICVRFDRDIRTAADFDAASKAFFLCGDFTDRATLMRLIDVDNFDSGSGFSDSKSRYDFFPSGPFVVIPKDWQHFVDNERITTHLNGQIAQDARGREMTLDFRELTQKVLNDVTSDRFIYRGKNYKLVEDAMIPKGSVLMSGTAEGVLFKGPTSGDMFRGIAKHILTGQFLSGTSGRETVVKSFVDSEFESKRYLQPDERVIYSASNMGTIVVEVK